MDKKELKEAYKRQTATGGVYRIVNTQNGKYIFNYAPDIRAKQNSFSFAVGNGMCFDNRARKDWEAAGGGVFRFEVLETLEQKKDQTPAEFAADLETLAQIWNEKLDAALKY